ncbi:phage Gp37/Gp68 family protein [Eoetvoesiella caeni]
MAENSKIEWTDHTFNGWEGCTKIGPGCDNCYAENRNARFAGGKSINWGQGAPRRRTSVANWNKPLAWNAQRYVECECGWRGPEHKLDVAEVGFFKGLAACPECNAVDFKPVRQRVFCSSLADVFDNEVDPAWRADLFRLIEKTPNLDWLVLTKRIGNVSKMIPDHWAAGMPSNVWLGATIVNQQEADRDIPKLMQIKANVRFLSMEPLLGSVDLSQWLDLHKADDIQTWARRNVGQLENMLDWIIVGGETGPGARPIHPDWVWQVQWQCETAGVPFLFKQWGDWASSACRAYGTATGEVRHIRSDGTFWGDDLPQDEDADVLTVVRVGKVAAGRLLTGQTWDGYPVRN